MDQSVVPRVASVDHGCESLHAGGDELEAKIAHRTSDGRRRFGTAPEVLHQSINGDVLVWALCQPLHQAEGQCVPQKARPLLPIHREGLALDAADGLDVWQRFRQRSRGLLLGQAGEFVNVLKYYHQTGA